MGEGDRGWSSNSGNLRYAGNAFRVGVQSSIATASLSNEMSGFSRSIRALVPSLVSWMRIGREAVQPRELSASYLAATNPRELALWAEERRGSERSPLGGQDEFWDEMFRWVLLNFPVIDVVE